MTEFLSVLPPLVLTALGALISALAGVLNIALEGLIQAGAFTAVLTTRATDSELLGILAAGLTGTLLAWGFGTFTIRTKANIFITGLAMNLLIPGLIALISHEIFGTKGVIRLQERGLGSDLLITILGPAVLLTLIYLYRTPGGIRIRAAGEEPRRLRAAGISPSRTRILALTLSGTAAALGGAYMALSISAWVPGISAGRGWMALVAVYLGGRTILGTVGAAVLFGGALWAALRIPGLPDWSTSWPQALPYLITLCALILGPGVRKGAHTILKSRK